MVETNCNCLLFFFQAEDGIRDTSVTGVQTCALPICSRCIYGSHGGETRGDAARARTRARHRRRLVLAERGRSREISRRIRPLTPFLFIDVSPNHSPDCCLVIVTIKVFPYVLLRVTTPQYAMFSGL